MIYGKLKKKNYLLFCIGKKEKQRMKFLLTAINAKYIHSNLAVYDMKAYASGLEGGKYEKDIEIAEYTINHRQDEIIKDLYLRKPDIIGFSCYIWNISMVEEIICELHKLIPGLEIWLGGPEVSYRAKELLERFSYLRGIMTGEGEKTFSFLLSYYKDRKGELKEIPGICYREKDGRIVFNHPAQQMDLSEIPFPYQKLEHFENRIIYYESSRGCPFLCSYCLSSIEKELRFRSLDMVKKDLQFFLDQNVCQVKFVDRTFNCKKDHAMEIWRYLLEHDNGITNFHFEIAGDLLGEEELELFSQMRPGLIQLEIGIQSTNRKTIWAIHRTMNLERLKEVVIQIQKKRKIHLHLDLIAGLPYEDYESFAQSFNDVYALQPDQLQLGFLKVLSGTEMSRRQEEYGIVCKEEPPYEVLFTKWLSFEEIVKLKGIEEMVEQYYNSAQFTHSLAFLLPYFSTPFSFWEAFSEFYEKSCPPGVKSSRIQKYEILLEFAKEFLKNQELKQLKEAMVYDVYLRENAKSRPSFAEERESYKETVKQFFIQEEKDRCYLPDYKEYNSRQLANLLHMERFYFCSGKDRRPSYVVFDYKNRNPLTFEAHTISFRQTSCGLAPVDEILRLLDEHYTTDYKCYLHHQTPWQLLIATILSAQCTDARVNLVTKDLFIKYPTLEAFAKADQKELEKDIHSTGFYRNKAKNIIACTQQLLERHQGKVPSEIEALTQLAGVGRKTANVIRGNIYHIPSVVVDTHVKRISRKLGLTQQEEPEKIEADLMEVLPEDHWILWNIQIITHGRGICTARNPDCERCFLRHLCRAAKK